MPYDGTDYLTTSTTEDLTQDQAIMLLRNDQAIMLLRNAQQLIKHGWCQGKLETKNWLGRPTYCMIGALKRAALQDCLPLSYGAHEIATQRLQKVVGDNIGGWNDWEHRKKKDVLRAFNHAIEGT